MNIFRNESGILGSASVDNLKRTFKEFLQQATEIRTKLGKQEYLLDKYLSYLFEASFNCAIKVSTSLQESNPTLFIKNR